MHLGFSNEKLTAVFNVMVFSLVFFFFLLYYIFCINRDKANRVKLKLHLGCCLLFEQKD